MTRKGRAVRATVSRVSWERKLLGTSGSAGNAGSRRSSASGGARASSGCSKNPKGATDLSKIRWFPVRSKTLGRRLDAQRFAAAQRAQACEGRSGGESPCVGPEMMCFEGGRQALGPRTRNQGGRAQAPSRPRSFRPRIPQSSRLHSTEDGRAQRTQQCVTASPLERV